MSKVLAKFWLGNVEDAKYATTDGAVSLQFYAVQGEPFGPATPSGYLTMVVQNTAAAAIFRDAFAAYLEVAKRWNDPAIRGDYPKQPEFYVTFKLDDGTGSD